MAEESSEGTGIAIPEIALVTDTAGVRIPEEPKCPTWSSATWSLAGLLQKSITDHHS